MQHCAALRNGISRKHADEAPHRVASVERALRATQHIDAHYVLKIEMIGRLVCKRHIVDIQSDSRRVDARTDATNVTSRRDATAVVGHKKVGRIGSQVVDRLNVAVFQALVGKQTDADGLAAKLRSFFGRSYNYCFFNVEIFERIGFERRNR